MQRLDPDTIMAVLPHAHVFTNAEGKGWGLGLIYLPEMLSLATILTLQHKGAVTVASTVRSLLVLYF